MTRIRFRTDSVTTAWRHALVVAGKEQLVGKGCPTECGCDDPSTCALNPAFVRATPPAEPGDCWRLTHFEGGALAGYAIACPQCREVHYWGSANNCGSRRPRDGGGWACEHTGRGSCWDWTGSAEEGTLTASPSLLATAPALCGWHGWLRNGELVPC